MASSPYTTCIVLVVHYACSPSVAQDLHELGDWDSIPDYQAAGVHLEEDTHPTQLKIVFDARSQSDQLWPVTVTNKRSKQTGTLCNVGSVTIPSSF